MTKFHWRDEIGRKGERLVQQYIEDTFPFIYRQAPPPDIGIDGEIELGNRAEKNVLPTGQLIKTQVKTTEGSFSGNSHLVAIDEPHLRYFVGLKLPVVLFAVSLADKQILWMEIDEIDAHRTKKGKFAVRFDKTRDLLHPGSDPDLRAVADDRNLVRARDFLARVDTALLEMETREALGGYDDVFLEFSASQLGGLNAELNSAQLFLDAAPDSNSLRPTLQNLRRRYENFKGVYKRWLRVDLLERWNVP